MKSVLIVEDEAISSLLLVKALSSNFKAEAVSTSNECLRICAKQSYDFILMDINLGKDSLDGIALLKALKRISNCKNTRFIAITANALPGDKDKYINVGFTHYFSKPLIFDQIIEKLTLISENNPIGSNT